MSSALQQYRITPNSTTSSVAVPITPTPDYVAQLNSLVHSQEVLASTGYIVKELSDEDLESKKRCSGCGIRMIGSNNMISTSPKLTPDKEMLRLQKNEKRNEKRNEQRNNKKKDKEHAQDEGNLERACAVSVSSSSSDTSSDGPVSHGVALPNSTPRMRCKFHSGWLHLKAWSCCGKNPTDPPCVQREYHIPRSDVSGETERLWQHHPTKIGQTQFSHRAAVAIDCEMGTTMSNDSELIRVTLLDYFSGQVLIDKLVWPDVPMLHLNTRFSGIRWPDLHNARRKRSCLFGRDNARAAVLKFIGPSTIVVGHSAHNDLTSLRWIHHRIVDTYILESALKEAAEKAVTESPQKTPVEPTTVSDTSPKNADGGQKRPKGRGLLSLKTLSKVKLGREIQVGRNGHDSIEDALAARDLVHVYLTSEDNRAVHEILDEEIRSMAT